VKMHLKDDLRQVLFIFKLTVSLRFLAKISNYF
jgi:hypothetical protein